MRERGEMCREEEGEQRGRAVEGKGNEKLRREREETL